MIQVCTLSHNNEHGRDLQKQLHLLLFFYTSFFPIPKQENLRRRKPKTVSSALLDWDILLHVPKLLIFHPQLLANDLDVVIAIGLHKVFYFILL